MKNLTARILENNKIVFFDDNNPEKEMFSITAPFMYDAKYEISKNISVSLNESKEGYTLILKPDENWLNSSDRVYPVTIDPYVNTVHDINNVDDSYVSEYYNDENYGDSPLMAVRKDQDGGNNCWIYTKFTLPAVLTAADKVTNAQFMMRTSQGDGRKLDVYEVTGTWDEYGITWDNKPSYDTKILDCVNSVANTTNVWDITGCVDEWYKNGGNNGLLLKYDSSAANGSGSFYRSSEDTYIFNRPGITIYYANGAGLEDYWTYNQQSVGRAGTSYVNLWNGNLVHVHDDLTMSGNRMPISLKHVYNLAYKDIDNGYGYGWDLSLNQRLENATIGGVIYYIYIDEDGTKHYFSNDGTVYKDDSGLNMTLSFDSTNNTITMKDKYDNLLTFYGYTDPNNVLKGRLMNIKDNNNNVMTMNYNGTLLQTITDGAGRVTTLYYDLGHLLSIADPALRTVCSFGYTGNQLTSITYIDTYMDPDPQRNYTIYNYNTNNLTKVICCGDDVNYKVSYSYNNNDKVEEVLESKADDYFHDTIGQRNRMVYNLNSTTVYNHSNSWSKSAYFPDNNGYGEYITKVVNFNNCIYAVTSTENSSDPYGGRLLEWNNTDGWIVKANRYPNQYKISSAIVYDNSIYASTQSTSENSGGVLLRWNGTNAWELAAPSISDKLSLMDLTVNDGRLFIGTYYQDNADAGRLYEYVNGQLVLRANRDINEKGVPRICSYQGNIYGTDQIDGRLYRWDGNTSWIEVSLYLPPDLLVPEEQTALSLIVYKNALFAGTNFGCLYRWNGLNSWEGVSGAIDNSHDIESMCVFNDKIYAGTERGYLYESDGISAWKNVASDVPNHNYQESVDLECLLVYNDKLYTGTHQDQLLEWNEDKTVYQFNNNGNTTSITDNEGNTQYFKYYTDGARKNKLEMSSKLQQSVMNYVKNSNIEQNSPSLCWISDNTIDSSGSLAIEQSSSNVYMGSRALKIVKDNDDGRQAYKQQVNLVKGKTYTLSAFVKTDSVTKSNSMGAGLNVRYMDNLGQEQIKSAPSFTGTRNWEKSELSFTVPLDSTSDIATISLGISGENGTAYFDCIQVEENKNCNRYNLVQNPDLTTKDFNSSTPDYWQFANCDSNDIVYTDTSFSYPQKLDTYNVKIVGNPSMDKKISQNINLSGKAGAVLAAGCWAKADSIPVREDSDAKFSLEIVLHYTDSSTEPFTIPFNDSVSYWQYCCGRVKATKDFTSVDIIGHYGNNCNTAYFDGFQLYMEEFGTIYSYDEDNSNLTSMTDMSNQTTTYSYCSNNEVQSVEDPAGRITSYNYYTDSHNVQDIQPTGEAKTNYTYDQYGNPMTVILGQTPVPSSSIQPTPTPLFIRSEMTYTSNGNYVDRVYDPSGNYAKYTFNESRGTLQNVEDPKRKVTTYTYDDRNNVSSVYKYKTLGNPTPASTPMLVKNEYVYYNDRLDKIKSNGGYYQFDYDGLGNLTGISVGNIVSSSPSASPTPIATLIPLVSNTYQESTSKLMETNYSNGQKINFYYDYLGRVKNINLNDTKRWEYFYDASLLTGYKSIYGTDGSSIDRNYRYMYDYADRPYKVQEYWTSPTSQTNVTYYGYGNLSNVTDVNDIIDAGSSNPLAYGTNYSYDIANRPLNTYYNRFYKNDGTMEYYTFNNTTNGSLGSYPINNSVSYAQDSDAGVPVLSADSNTDLMYHLRVQSAINTTDSGTMLLWFNTSNVGSTIKYIFSNEKVGGGNLSLYIGTDSKLKLSYRKTDNSFEDVITSSATVPNNTWYFTAVTWQISGTSLILNLYRSNGSAVFKENQVTVSNFKDFTGAETFIGKNVGNSGNGTCPLNGTMTMLGYSSSLYSQTDVNNIYLSGRGSVEANNYDALGRIDAKKIYTHNYAGFQYTTNYSYVSGANGSSTNLLASITNNGTAITYEYDENGNIHYINRGLSNEIHYEYDELNELVREDNKTPGINKTITYTYDAGGNMLYKKEYAYSTPHGTLVSLTATYSYQYDTVWKDKLTNYNGNTLSYDNNGNLTDDQVYTYGWEGTNLLSMNKKDGTQNISFKYDDNGIRTEKIVGSTVTSYHLVGNTVTYETNGTDKIYYTYDAVGNLVSMNLNGTEYYYVRNGQGDIIGLFDKSGTQVVTYVYNSWGKLISTTDNSGVSLGTKNPYRYRGYRYDSETGLYYCQSRYYNPEWGRWISVDAFLGTPGQLLSHNLYAYCGNNPVMGYDPTGFIDKAWSKIMFWWSYGFGKSRNIVNDSFWTNYMESNSMLKGFVSGRLTDETIFVKRGSTKYISTDFHTQFTNDCSMENGYWSGYELLHTPIHFYVTGNITKDLYGNVTFDLTYKWADRIDPDFNQGDLKYYKAAKCVFITLHGILGDYVCGIDYDMSITWHATSKRYANGEAIGWPF